MHDFERYQAYHQSLEPDDELDTKLAQLELRIEKQNISLTQHKALIDAFKVLQECCRTLKYTYPFAFYLPRTNEAKIFEENQAALVAATEALFECYGKRTNEEEQPADVLRDKTGNCKRRREALLALCKQGYEQNYWVGLDQL